MKQWYALYVLLCSYNKIYNTDSCAMWWALSELQQNEIDMLIRMYIGMYS